MIVRLLAAGFGLLTLYSLRFFVGVRQDASTLVQIGLLVLATAVLVAPVRAGLRATSWQLWATSVVVLGLLVAVFAWADLDSHSVSDTLNRAVPTMCLILAVVLRVAASHSYNRGGAHI